MGNCSGKGKKESFEVENPQLKNKQSSASIVNNNNNQVQDTNAQQQQNNINNTNTHKETLKTEDGDNTRHKKRSSLCNKNNENFTIEQQNLMNNTLQNNANKNKNKSQSSISSINNKNNNNEQKPGLNKRQSVVKACKRNSIEFQKKHSAVSGNQKSQPFKSDEEALQQLKHLQMGDDMNEGNKQGGNSLKLIQEQKPEQQQIGIENQ